MSREREVPVLPPLHDAFTSRIRERLSRSDRPCAEAARSFLRGEYCLGLYEHFGEGRNRADLRNDLLWFSDEVRVGRSAHTTFWAVFPNAEVTDEDDFTRSMRRELAYLTGAALEASPDACRIRIEGHALFVVGLHPRSSHSSGRFPWTALVFNAVEQFAWLKREGLYDWIRGGAATTWHA